MRFYEVVMISRPDLTPQQADALAAKFTDIAKEQGAKIGKTESWGLRQLAYRIKKSRKGHYHMVNITATPAAVAEMERHMSLSEDLLRFLTVRVEKHEDGPSVQMRFKDREEGFDREGDFGAPRREHHHRGDRDHGPRDGYRARPQAVAVEDDSDVLSTPSDE